MKKFFVLPLLIIGLAGCETYNRAPYSGTMGDYGFTYDLDNSPSPLVDTGYRPLTPFDLAAPIIITVTNQAPPRVVYKDPLPIGETLYSGETPARSAVVTVAPEIREAAGAQPQAPQGAPGAGAAAPYAGTGPGAAYFSAPGVTVFAPTNFPGGTNTNTIPTNNIPTNDIPTNRIPTNGIPTNNIPTNGVPTNFAPVPNPQLRTNFPFRTNTTGTNRVLLNQAPAPGAERPGVQPRQTTPTGQPPAPSVQQPAIQPRLQSAPTPQPTPTPPPAPGAPTP
jgi:hypothetical protein